MSDKPNFPFDSFKDDSTYFDPELQAIKSKVAREQLSRVQIESAKLILYSMLISYANGHNMTLEEIDYDLLVVLAKDQFIIDMYKNVADE